VEGSLQDEISSIVGDQDVLWRIEVEGIDRIPLNRRNRVVLLLLPLLLPSQLLQLPSVRNISDSIYSCS